MDPITLAAAKSYVDESLLGAGALKGEDGFSPIITESPNNTEEVYQLDITNQSGSYRTPNLKGGSNGGESGLTPLSNVEIMRIINKANEQTKL